MFASSVNTSLYHYLQTFLLYLSTIQLSPPSYPFPRHLLAAPGDAPGHSLRPHLLPPLLAVLPHRPAELSSRPKAPVPAALYAILTRPKKVSRRCIIYLIIMLFIIIIVIVHCRTKISFTSKSPTPIHNQNDIDTAAVYI